MNPQENVVYLEGPVPFLDAVFESIDAHLKRTGEEMEGLITGVGAEEAGDVDHKEEAVLHLYIPATAERDDAREPIDLVLDRIADENSMDLARQSVQVTFEEEAEGEE